MGSEGEMKDMTKDEQLKLGEVVGKIDSLVFQFSLMDSKNDKAHDTIHAHLERLNGQAHASYTAIFGESGDDPSLMKRIYSLEKSTKWIREKYLWFWALLVAIGMMGGGGIVSQLLGGIWKN